jgi:UTP--glucose-1-phosphate uridylyltransferase
MMHQVKKAVFPVAGLGTRFLPATKTNPKEMLPIVDKPLIQHAVTEAVNAGIEQIIFVTAMGKRSIEDYFDQHLQLEYCLKQAGKTTLLANLNQITPDHVNFVYVRQNKPLGLGHAIWCARHVVGNEAFAVLLADDLIEEKPSGHCLRQMIDIHAEHGGHVIAHETIAHELVNQYGIMRLENNHHPFSRMLDIVEKPDIAHAPSNLAAIGRYILLPQIFDQLNTQTQGVGHEIQLTDAIRNSISELPAWGYHLQGKRFDCGSKLGYMKANVHFAMQHPEIGQAFTAHLQDILSEEMVG